MRIAKAWAGCSVVVTTLALAGCYAPSIRRCELACASGEQCPDGLTCNTNNMCASSRNDLCTGGSDGSIDVPTDVPRDSACTWRPTSNVEPCALDADLAMTDFAVNGTMTVDTSLIALSASQLTGEPIALVKVRDLIIGPAGNLVVIGNRPLVILVAGTARIEGGIGYAAAADPGVGVTCAGSGGIGTGGTGGTLGSGGGGGGHGTIGLNVSGAAGGSVVNGGISGAGGVIVGVGRLVPLTMGCAGGRGGGGTNPGRGGGAIQISARGSLVVSGRIEASGGGGGNATGIAAGSGGGAGGGILLEAETLNLTGAQLCANGGGGGGGGAQASSPLAQDATCSLAAARGGGSGTATVGGAGATGTIQAGVGQTANASSGGAGGGGGPGWIRINGVQTGSPMLSTPAFSPGS